MKPKSVSIVIDESNFSSSVFVVRSSDVVVWPVWRNPCIWIFMDILFLLCFPILMNSRRGVDPRASQTRSKHLEFHFSARIFHRNSWGNDPLSICSVFPPPNKPTSHRHSEQRYKITDPLDFVLHWIYKRQKSVETNVESSNSLIDWFYSLFPGCLRRCVGGFQRRSLLYQSVK